MPDTILPAMPPRIPMVNTPMAGDPADHGIDISRWWGRTAFLDKSNGLHSNVVAVHIDPPGTEWFPEGMFQVLYKTDKPDDTEKEEAVAFASELVRMLVRLLADADDTEARERITALADSPPREAHLPYKGFWWPGESYKVFRWVDDVRRSGDAEQAPPLLIIRP